MVRRGSVAVALAALLLGVGAAQAAAQEDSGQRMVMVYGSEAQIAGLENAGYDVGYVGDKDEAAVYVDDQQEALLRAQGFQIGSTVEAQSDWEARKAETPPPRPARRSPPTSRR